MAHRSRAFFGVMVVLLLVVGAAQGGGVASPFGTWFGTPKFPNRPHDVYDPIKLVAGAGWVQVVSTGLTAASHDPPDAKSTCTTRYQFSSEFSAGGWRLYIEEGKPRISGSVSGGPPSSGICGSTPSGVRDAVRLQPAGTKLSVEFGIVNTKAKATDPRATSFDSYFKRGYLHH